MGLSFWNPGWSNRRSGGPIPVSRPRPTSRSGVVPGASPEPAGLLRAVPEQRRRPEAWPDLIMRTLVAGGDGYGRHSAPAARPDSRELRNALHRIGENCGPAVPSGVDFTHFDFHFMNLPGDGRAVAGIIGINPPLPAAAGRPAWPRWPDHYVLR